MRQLKKDEIVTQSLYTESEQIELRLIPTINKKGWREEIERNLKNGRLEDGVEMLLEKMLRFLAEMPVDEHHDYGEFRHKGLRSYLIHRFMTDKWHARSARHTHTHSRKETT
jgi:hypothetical protein